MPDLQSAKDFLGDITAALRWREAWESLFEVEKNDQYYQGAQGIPNSVREDQDLYITNLVFSTIRAAVPGLFLQDPWFSVSSELESQRSQENISEAVLNFFMTRRQKLRKLGRLMILDAFLAYGVGKTVFTRETTENPDKGKEILDENQQPLLDDEGNVVREPDRLPTEERFLTVRVPPLDFLVNAECGNSLTEEDGHIWSAQRMVLPIETVKNDFRFKKKRRMIEEAGTANEETLKKVSRKYFRKRARGEEAGLTGEITFDREHIILWEVHHPEERKIYTLIDDYDQDFLHVADFPEGMDRGPYEPLKFNEIPDQFYPIPEVSQWRDPQDEYNLIRTQRNFERRRSVRVYLRDPNAVQEEEMDKLYDPVDGDHININTRTNRPIKDALSELAQSRPDAGIVSDVQMILRDFAQVSGQSSETRGSPESKFATQATIIQQGVKARELDMQDAVVEFFEGLAGTTLRLLQHQLTIPQAIRIAGPMGAQFFEDVTQEDIISGKFWLDVDLGPKSSMSPELETRRIIEFLGILGRFPGMALVPGLMDDVLAKLGIKDPRLTQQLMVAAMLSMGTGPGPGRPGVETNNGGSGEGSIFGAGAALGNT